MKIARQFRRASRRKGFTLIELMIVVAIVAILSALAMPSYFEYIERGRRNDAKAVLLEAAQVMERRFTEARDYTLATLPTPVTKSPRDSGVTYYRISIAPGVTRSTFTLLATPVGWTPRRCGTLTLDHLGQKGQSNSTIDECWYK